MTTSSLPIALRAGAEGLYALEAITGLIVAHGTWLARGDFLSFIHHGAGTAAIDWEAVISALDAGRRPSSGGEKECSGSLRVSRGHPRPARRHPGSFSPAVQQKIHHAFRIKATGIHPESNVRQSIEPALDDFLKLVDRPAVGRGLDAGGECRSLVVISVAITVRQIRGFFGQPVNPGGRFPVTATPAPGA